MPLLSHYAMPAVVKIGSHDPPTLLQDFYFVCTSSVQTLLFIQPTEDHFQGEDGMTMAVAAYCYILYEMGGLLMHGVIFQRGVNNYSAAVILEYSYYSL